MERRLRQNAAFQDLTPKSSRLYDPRKGHVGYHQYMDQLEYAETLGFDGIGCNERLADGERAVLAVSSRGRGRSPAAPLVRTARTSAAIFHA